MAKGYWIVRVDVTDPEVYKEYALANAEAFAKYGGRFVVRGGRYEIAEGRARGRNVVIEFDSFDKAWACWTSPEYERAAAIRRKSSVADVVIIDGYDGPQPG